MKNAIFQWLLGTSWLQSLLLKLLRNALTAGGAALLAWLTSHGVDNASANQLTGELAAAAMTLAGLGLSWLDAHVVNGKIASATVVGATSTMVGEPLAPAVIAAASTKSIVQLASAPASPNLGNPAP